MPTTTVEKQLEKLQRLVRATPVEGRPARWATLPPRLSSDEQTTVSFSREEVDAIKALSVALAEDLRFEHLRRPDKAAEMFAMECFVNKRGSRVAAFVEENGREPADRICYLPVLHLKVTRRNDIVGIALLPPTELGLPSLDGPFRADAANTGSIAAIEVTGTDLQRMAERAKLRAERALRILRVALRAHRSINDRQLRFSLGTAYAFDERLGGWSARQDVAYELGLDARLVELVKKQAVASVSLEPKTRLQRAVHLALEWVERARMSGDPLVALLFEFFALEAVIGDKAEGQKAQSLAFRQALIALDQTGGFRHPDRTWFLYDRVRSSAVHGSPPPPVDWKVAGNFAWAVNITLDQYLRLVEEHGLTSRGAVLTYLRKHPRRDDLLQWLRERGAAHWRDYAGPD